MRLARLVFGLRSRRPQVRILSGAPTSQALFLNETRSPMAEEAVRTASRSRCRHQRRERGRLHGPSAAPRSVGLNDVVAHLVANGADIDAHDFAAGLPTGWPRARSRRSSSRAGPRRRPCWPSSAPTRSSTSPAPCRNTCATCLSPPPPTGRSPENRHRARLCRSRLRGHAWRPTAGPGRGRRRPRPQSLPAHPLTVHPTAGAPSGREVPHNPTPVSGRPSWEVGPFPAAPTWRSGPSHDGHGPAWRRRSREGTRSPTCGIWPHLLVNTDGRPPATTMPGEETIGFEHRASDPLYAHNILAVPPNQREYSWDEEHVSDLLSDLLTPSPNTHVAAVANQPLDAAGGQRERTGVEVTGQAVVPLRRRRAPGRRTSRPDRRRPGCTSAATYARRASVSSPCPIMSWLGVQMTGGS